MKQEVAFALVLLPRALGRKDITARGIAALIARMTHRGIKIEEVSVISDSQGPRFDESPRVLEKLELLPGGLLRPKVDLLDELARALREAMRSEDYDEVIRGGRAIEMEFSFILRLTEERKKTPSFVQSPSHL